MLWWDDNSWVAKSLATAIENEPKRSSHRCRKEGKELLTLRMPQVGRNLQQEMPLIPLPTLKWGLGRGGSCLHLIQSLRCIARTWAALGWPCPPTKRSITGSGHAFAFLLRSGIGVGLNIRKDALLFLLKPFLKGSRNLKNNYRSRLWAWSGHEVPQVPEFSDGSLGEEIMHSAFIHRDRYIMPDFWMPQ